MKILQDFKSNFITLRFSIFNGFNKIFQAFAPIFAIYVTTSLFISNEITIMFLLFGYLAWFQLFELGFSQTLQNKYNLKEISTSDFYFLCILHFLFVLLLAIILYVFSVYAFLLSDQYIENYFINSFSLGCSILIISSNNLLIQRLLMVLNADITINKIQFLQTLLSVLGITFCLLNKENNLYSLIIFYFSPFLIINFLSLIYVKYIFNLKLKFQKSLFKSEFFTQILFYSTMGILSSIYIGLDYYFASQLLKSSQINEYIFILEFFYIFYFYYSFVQYSTKNISKNYLTKNFNDVVKYKFSIIIGLLAVFGMFLLTVIINNYE